MLNVTVEKNDWSEWISLTINAYAALTFYSDDKRMQNNETKHVPQANKRAQGYEDDWKSMAVMPEKLKHRVE